ARFGSLWPKDPLDTRVALREKYPDDAAAAEELAKRPRGVILEATGGPYTWHGRLASFPGYPTVVGWGHHEAGWRNVWTPMLERIAQVKDAYTQPTPERLRQVI